MEIKKIVEGMTAPQVAQVIDENFNALNGEKANVEDVADVQKNVNRSDDNTGVLSYPEYSSTEPVAVGDVRRYEGLLYRAKEVGAYDWDPEKWERVTLKQLEDEKLAELGSEVGNFYLVGNNKDVSIFNYKNTIGGNVYRVYLDNTSYDVSGVPEGFIKLNIGYIVNGEAVYSYQYSTHTDLRKYYDVEIPKDSVSAEMIISIRATKGVKVWFRIEDITECVNLSSEISSIDEVSNESASFLQGKSHAIHGAIEQDSGVVISNNIRAITLPIRHKMSDIGKEVRVKCSLPESIVFNGISYAYLGDTPVKRITVAYENEYLSYMTDASFDNIRTTFKRIDEGVKRIKRHCCIV